MAKKKSKTQKYKQNIKKKAKRLQQNAQNTQILPKEKQKNIEPILENTTKKTKKEVISNEKVNKKIKHNPQKKIIVSNWKKILKEFQNKFSNKKNKENEIELPKFKKTQTNSKKNIFLRLLYELKTNIHIIFSAILILTFIILLIGLIRINVLETGKIIYICCIILFLMIIAISYNKYPSGKIFTIFLCIGMFFAIYKMQYTYDFIRNLNSKVYEYKTYYVVTFDNVSNRSIYSLNNKNIGLLKDNRINIERKLNTKLDKVDYIEYDDINVLFYDFYNQKFRAILVNENQYKYLQNNIENNKKVKILYEFKANAKK